MDFNDYFEKGIAYYQNYEYGPAIANLKEALKLRDTPELRDMIKKMEEAAAFHGKKSYHEGQAAYFNSLAEEAQGRF